MVRDGKALQSVCADCKYARFSWIVNRSAKGNRMTMISFQALVLGILRTVIVECSRGMALWELRSQVRSMPGPEEKLGNTTGVLWRVTANNKAEDRAPALLLLR